ncbi:MAG: hypothetical protein KBG48_01885 [Kofleriaceae bacterium]|jgi:hypothetical protein|nr:hypothetical protein [Kofleriaceae bacterium]MBP9166098.1 hypothetical protein [Kofleriaceae bacterium]MBP9856928.1 hypothetical protein [Kofleriaceae bacterium]
MGNVTITYDCNAMTFTVNILEATPGDSSTAVDLANGTLVSLATVNGKAVTLTAAPGDPLGQNPLVADGSTYTLNATEPFVLSFGGVQLAITPWVMYTAAAGFNPTQITTAGAYTIEWKVGDTSQENVATSNTLGVPMALFVEQGGNTTFDIPTANPFTVIPNLDNGEYDAEITASSQATPIRVKIIISTPKK